MDSTLIPSSGLVSFIIGDPILSLLWLGCNSLRVSCRLNRWSSDACSCELSCLALYNAGDEPASSNINLMHSDHAAHSRNLASTGAAMPRLTPSLLTRTFRGQLVPQDPAGEPAAVLLQRVRQGKAVQ